MAPGRLKAGSCLYNSNDVDLSARDRHALLLGSARVFEAAAASSGEASLSNLRIPPPSSPRRTRRTCRTRRCGALRLDVEVEVGEHHDLSRRRIAEQRAPRSCDAHHLLEAHEPPSIATAAADTLPLLSPTVVVATAFAFAPRNAEARGTSEPATTHEHPREAAPPPPRRRFAIALERTQRPLRHRDAIRAALRRSAALHFAKQAQRLGEERFVPRGEMRRAGPTRISVAHVAAAHP